ncbi:MAG: MerR family transcriptional regulator [Bauldia sp.]
MTVGPVRTGDGAAASGKSPDAFRTISEVAEELDLPQHVLRFWETRFAQIKPMKRGGGRRYYRRDDVDLLRGIRHLLYSDGYTIKGVQRILKTEGVRFVVGIGHGEAAPPPQGSDREEGGEGAIGAEEASQGPLDNGGDDGDEFAERGGSGEADGDTEGASSRPLAALDPALLKPADVRALEGVLSELLECKRLLDRAR